MSDTDRQQIRTITDPVLAGLDGGRRFFGEPLNWVRRRWLRVFPGGEPQNPLNDHTHLESR